MRIEELGLCPPSEFTSILAMSYAEFRLACAYRELYSMVESLLNHHLAGLLGLGSLSVAGHQVHVSLPINQFLNARVDPKEIPLHHEFILNRDLLAQLYPSFFKGATPFFTLNYSKYADFVTFCGGLDPVTGCLWLTDNAHHHLSIAILFLIVGHMYKTNWGIGHGLKDILEAHKGPYIGQVHKGLYEILTTSWHAQLSLNLAMLSSLTIVIDHHMCSMPPYPYLSTKYGTQLLLFTHHMWIGGFLIVGATAHAAIFMAFTVLVCIFIMIPGALRGILKKCFQIPLYNYNPFFLNGYKTPMLYHMLQWLLVQQQTPVKLGGVGDLVAVTGKVALLPIPFGTANILVHHIHEFMIHVTVLILLKGVLFAHNSRFILNKANLGFCFPCDGPRRGGTCQSDVLGSVSDQGVVTHITGENFAKSSITINGWLRNFLWA
ncbi:Photosystem I chlorophyll a apoprotein A1 [Capsicum baccatum]|uniref:Photosystem I chlorophyll a apoprotein A1 n=1 Tax=Capsicum baccatum TaxID=33114 RepID=A0A2G2XM59_CAPBA|nr:Photosystem I chlorophyll a apoprotein A1 [Capsicum baccatum]